MTFCYGARLNELGFCNFQTLSSKKTGIFRSDYFSFFAVLPGMLRRGLSLSLLELLLLQFLRPFFRCRFFDIFVRSFGVLIRRACCLSSSVSSRITLNLFSVLNLHLRAIIPLRQGYLFSRKSNCNRLISVLIYVAVVLADQGFFQFSLKIVFQKLSLLIENHIQDFFFKGGVERASDQGLLIFVVLRALDRG